MFAQVDHAVAFYNAKVALTLSSISNQLHEQASSLGGRGSIFLKRSSLASFRSFC
jgi:hypothetical protein